MAGKSILGSCNIIGGRLRVGNCWRVRGRRVRCVAETPAERRGAKRTDRDKRKGPSEVG